ncbi:MAG: hypothetical protein JWM76_3799, partial [Pseudonocardiales bacterium]|nr:hypothetical protein [Pseudonocardiales bacterium]
HNKPEIFDAIVNTGLLTDDTIALLQAACDEAKQQFLAEASAGSGK